MIVIRTPHLSSKQAHELLEKYGPNTLSESTAHSPIKIFFDQFKNVLVFLLLGATIVSYLLGDTLDAVLILSIVILNAILGFVQEHKAEKALAALKKMTIAMVRVVRDNEVVQLESTQLVPGDVIFLEEGDKVPADAIIVESFHAEVNEAALTGESLPVEKNSHGENQIYMGTIVARGRLTAKITSTGMQTRFGSIAAKLGSMTDDETPLEKKMGIVGKQLGIIALVCAGIIFGYGFIRQDPIFESIITAISLAVAAVPEGLPAVVTIALAVGTQRMARQRSILRKLSAIESLGSVTVIATDKTGTLTQNDMRVSDVWVEGKTFKAGELRHKKLKSFEQLLKCGILCNNATLSGVVDGDRPSVVGDKTEGSLLLLAHELGHPYEDIRTDGRLIEEFAFNPELKTMTVVWKSNTSSQVFTKGAPEAILARSKQAIIHGKLVTLTASQKKSIEQAFRGFASRGLRMIALASREITWKKQDRESVERDLTFLGFVGISDPVRPEARDAVTSSKKAGIITIMVTGDNELTGKAIGQQVGLLTRGDKVLTGSQLETLTDEQAKEALLTTRVFARTTPEQKHRLVKLLQEMGHVVAVTGDGVNDSLALKQADVGVAMGKTGTDVAKEASDMIITDDNYASLVVAIEEGRTIFDNIKSTTKYLIGCNIGEIGAITLGVLLGWPFILSPLHILYVNLVTDGLPAIGLALTPKQGDIMKRAPRTEKTIFNKHDLLWFGEVGLLTTFAVLVSFVIGSGNSVSLGRTLAFLAMILAQQYIFYDIASRNNTIMKLSFKHFPWALLPIGIIIIQILLLGVPAFKHVFNLETPPLLFSLFSILLTTGLLITSELRKKFGKHLYYHH